MWQDPIVEEVRQVRERHAEKFRFDLWAIYQDLKQQEIAGSGKLVTLAPRKRQQSRSRSKPKQTVHIQEPQMV